MVSSDNTKKMILLFFNLIFILSCTAKEKSLYEISINEIIIDVEIADTAESRQKGLMFKDSLPEEQGMLFIFEKEQKMSFWMKNTEIPLSIAYISKSGVIREIHNLYPLSEKAVQSSHSVLYALEVNQGFFDKKGIKVGDSIHFSF
jgi:uncharacterized protein